MEGLPCVRQTSRSWFVRGLARQGSRARACTVDSTRQSMKFARGQEFSLLACLCIYPPHLQHHCSALPAAPAVAATSSHLLIPRSVFPNAFFAWDLRLHSGCSNVRRFNLGFSKSLFMCSQRHLQVTIGAPCRFELVVNQRKLASAREPPQGRQNQIHKDSLL